MSDGIKLGAALLVPLLLTVDKDRAFLRFGKRLRYTITLPIFGTCGQIRDVLLALGLSRKIQTSYIERSNLALRNLIDALHRWTWALPWSTTTLTYRLAWLLCCYHFCRPHMSLTNNNINGQIYKRCTLAIKAGLTDRIWATQDVLFWRPSPVAS